MAGFRGNAILRRLPSESVPCRAVEVGVDEGTTSGWLLGWHRNLTLVMVDFWGVTYYRDAAKCSKVEKLAMARTTQGAGRRHIFKGASVDIAYLIADGSLDLAFIDGDHEYESVRDDVAAWLPKVRKGGWIGGHDYWKAGGFRGVDRAVDEAFGAKRVELDEDSTWWVRL
jgi:predicted O-methyltransferase YrrM